MKLQILHVPGCPNVATLEARLTAVLAGHHGVEVSRREVGTLDEAAATGMTGSPTLLVDGVDPFPAPGQAPSVSCRLYRNSTGRADGAPSHADLQGVLGSRVSAAKELRSVRERAVPVQSDARGLHQDILLAFASTGRPPTIAYLQVTATAFGRPAAQILSDLHDRDVIRLDRDGQITVAYPFSALPTRHQVRLADGTQVFAMCAIDALGIPAMLDTDAEITSTDPASDHTITVSFANGLSTWNPATAVVFVGAEPGGGPSADCCCDHLNFFSDRNSAQAWVDAHPGTPGAILNPAEAERLGADIFGRLLAP